MITRSRRRTTSSRGGPRRRSTVSATSSAPATWPGPVSAACTASAISAAGRCAGWRRSHRSRRAGTRTASLVTSTTYEECSDEPRSKRGTERGMSMTDVRNVIVVGGTAGIGREVAKRYADEGGTVVLTGRNAGQVEAVAKEIGGDARGLAVELAEPHSNGGGPSDNRTL